ncbi:MAG TPA: hypothetical protein PK587_08020 [Syntrophales bacterium]|nr:hypothetical protein [Syntrophales bacterium]
MDKLRDRVAWAIDALKSRPESRGITDEEIARSLSTNKNTIGNYRRKRGLIKGIVLERLVTEYGLNPEWLLRGRGEPFPGASEAEAASPPAFAREAGEKYEALLPGETEAGMTVSEALRMSIEILDSGSRHAIELRTDIGKIYRDLREEKSRKGIHDDGQPALRESVESLHWELVKFEERIRNEFQSALEALRQKETARKPGKRHSRSKP